MAKQTSTIGEMAAPRGKYPHLKRAGDLLFVSGISSRRADNTFEGADSDRLGNVTLDIRVQTRAVIQNVGQILASGGAGLGDLVQVTCYLVDMNDFIGFNEIYGKFFSENGPTRTTVAVRQLPHPHILIEMNGIAFKPAT
jgi:2-aminomuconate deaminase